VAVKTIFKLRERGCPLQTARKAISYLKRHYPSGSGSKRLASLTLITDGHKVYMLTSERQVMEVVTHQHVWSVPLGLLIRETREEVKALAAEWTEEVKVAGKTYRLDVIREANTETYTVQCRELPGAIEQADTSEQAIANGKSAIRSVLKFVARRQRRAGRTKRVQAG